MIENYLIRLLNLIQTKLLTTTTNLKNPTNNHEMQYTILGRTGLKVSVMGLGGGGESKLGKNKGKPQSESIKLVHRAIDLGINLIDTAEAYGTEKIIGEAIKSFPRENLIISTKKTISYQDKLISPKQLIWGLDKSLWRLKTDYIDIYHLHGVKLSEYDYVCQELIPTLIQLKREGKIRFIGITEPFSIDTNHQMLYRAIQDNYWDVIMTGFNLLNQSAKNLIFPTTIAKNIGVLSMFAVRKALKNEENLRKAIKQIQKEGELNHRLTIDTDNPLDFLIHKNGAKSLMDAAYRYCRYQKGVNVVLFGTSEIEHLEANVTSLLSPCLPEQDLDKLDQLFGNVSKISGN